MSLEQQTDAAPQTDAPMTAASLADAFKAELDAESAPAKPAPAPQPEAPDEAAPETESAPEAETAQPEQAEPSEAETATPAIDPPRSMSAEERAIFEQLPPEAKAWLAKREKEGQADYTRKTQEVAEQRKQYEQMLPALINQLHQYDGILSRFTAQPPQPPDPALRQTDPLAFDDQMADYHIRRHQFEQAQQEQSRVRAEMQQHQQAQRKAYWAEQGKILAEKAPKLAADTPEGKKLRTEVFEYASKAGYSQEQLANASATDLITLWKAHQFDAAKSIKPVVPQPAAAPKVVQPGPAKAASRNNGFASAVRSLSENPTREALAAAYRAELAAER